MDVPIGGRVRAVLDCTAHLGPAIFCTIFMRPTDERMKRHIADWLLALPTLLFTYWTVYGFLYREMLFDGAVGVMANGMISTFLAVVCLLLLRWKSPYRAKLGVSIVSTLLALFLAETVLSLRRQSQLQSARRAHEMALQSLGDDYDSRPTRQVIADLKKEGVRAVAPVRAGDSLQAERILSIDGKEIVALGGIANTIVVLCNECGKYLIYESDDFGFHNPKGLHRPGAVDILALGDSFVQGSCVASEQNAIARIRTVYPRTLNLGTVGKGPLAMLATLREYGEYLRPKTVLWFYYEGNDLADLQREKKTPLIQYLAPDFSLGLRDLQPEIDRLLGQELEERLQQVDQESHSDDMILPRTESVGEMLFLRELRTRLLPGRLTDELNLLQRILACARERVKAAGGNMYFVYLPEFMRFNPGNPPGSYRGRHRVRQMVEGLGLPFIDVSAAFHAHEDPLSLFPFRLPGHFNEAGYRVMADTVLKAMDEKR